MVRSIPVLAVIAPFCQDSVADGSHDRTRQGGGENDRRHGDGGELMLAPFVQLPDDF